MHRQFYRQLVCLAIAVLLVDCARAGVAAGWARVREAVDKQREVEIVVTMPSRNAAALNLLVDSRAAPGAVFHGHGLSADEVRQLTMPRGETVRAVQGWLRASGVQGTLSYMRDIATFSAPVWKLEGMLGVTFRVYRRSSDGVEVSRALEEARLPAELAGAGVRVFGQAELPPEPRRKGPRAARHGCSACDAAGDAARVPGAACASPSEREERAGVRANGWQQTPI